MALLKATVDEQLAARIRALAVRGDRSVSSEINRALRAWVDVNGPVSEQDLVRAERLAPPVAPPPVLPPVRRLDEEGARLTAAGTAPSSSSPRTTMCVHRRPPSSFCRYCDA